MSEAKRDAMHSKLASTLGRRDEQPNMDLANALCANENADEVAAVCEILQNGNSAAKSDAIKVLYETGRMKPQLIKRHISVFLETMNVKDNRLVWGALTALAAVSKVAPQEVFDQLSSILKAADNGSVIAKDQAVEILIELKKLDGFAAKMTPFLMDSLRSAAVNQLPMYAERISAVLNSEDRAIFCEILTSRLDEHMKQSKQKRLVKVIRTVESAK